VSACEDSTWTEAGIFSYSTRCATTARGKGKGEVEEEKKRGTTESGGGYPYQMGTGPSYRLTPLILIRALAYVKERGRGGKRKKDPGLSWPQYYPPVLINFART